MIYHMSKEVARNRADTMPALPAVVNAAVAAKYPHLSHPSCSTSAKYPHRHLNICLSSSPPIHLEVEPNAGRWHRRVQRRRTTARRDSRSKQVICELSKTYGSAFFYCKTHLTLGPRGRWVANLSFLQLGVGSPIIYLTSIHDGFNFRPSIGLAICHQNTMNERPDVSLKLCAFYSVMVWESCKQCKSKRQQIHHQAFLLVYKYQANVVELLFAL